LFLEILRGFATSPREETRIPEKLGEEVQIHKVVTRELVKARTFNEYSRPGATYPAVAAPDHYCVHM
jgi:hypothetical protein